MLVEVFQSLTFCYVNFLFQNIKIHILLIVAWPEPKLLGGWSPNNFGPMDPGILGIAGKLLSL